MNQGLTIARRASGRNTTPRAQREQTRHAVHEHLQAALDLLPSAGLELMTDDLLDLRLSATRLHHELREGEEAAA
jgi:hypothetical protein